MIEDGYMKLCSLLLSHDARVLKILSLLLSDLAIQVDVCTRLEEAQEKLSDRKFDGIFADCGHPGAFELIGSVKKSRHNKRSIAFAIVDRDAGLRSAFQSGAHFVIHKPLSVEGSKRTLRAAHGLLMREKRSHFRNDISVPGALSINAQVPNPVLLLDLHRTGALIESPMALKTGQTVRLMFTVPESTEEVEAIAIVRWTDIAGRAGVHFQSVSKESERALLDWAKKSSVELNDFVETLGANPGITGAFERVRSVDLRCS
jgi:CheY-like chemotaxis protein